MLVLIKHDLQEVSREAARIIANAVKKKPCIGLGLATGGTMLDVYQELARLHREEDLDFSRASTFNLDEYLGLSPQHPQSFHAFMQQGFFSRVNVSPRNIHIPDGMVKTDFDQYCASYEQSIRQAGGIDLQILGIGRNGHIGFNEPTSSLGSRTRVKVLNKETVEDNHKFFAPGEEVPRTAITMGIGTILEAGKILLLAAGEAKAEAVARAIEGPVTSSLPASALQLHPDVTFLVDHAAAALLTQKEYYREVMEMTSLLTPERMS